MLQRVRERDLYSCSAAIRIPQLEQFHQTCNKCKDKVIESNLKVVKTLHKSDSDKNEFANNVCEHFKASVKTSKLEPEDIWVEVGCDIHYLNEYVWMYITCR